LSCEALGLRLLSSVGDLLRRSSCDCVLFSGGIDTSFVTLAAVEAGLRPKLITVLFQGSADEPYAEYISKVLGLDLVKVRPTPEEALECVDVVLRSMVTIDPIEAVSGSAVCLGLRKAKELGCRCVATGDGGDELFIGYDFLFGRDRNYLDGWLSRVANSAFFNSVPISAQLGVSVLLPLYSDEAKAISREAFNEGCDVRDVNGTTYGKYLMRRVLELKGLSLVAWRRKDPITRGSGSEQLLGLMSSLVGDDDVRRLTSLTGVLVPSRPHAYLLGRRLSLGLPMPSRATRNPCPICGSELRDGFCRFCGAYIDEAGGLSVYSDDASNISGASRLLSKGPKG
jgi:asparagine synthase (glutamine-hydrolysing)